MSRDSTWTNPDGLVVGFGAHTPDNEVAAVHNSGVKRTLSMLVDLVNLEIVGTVTAASFDGRSVVLPRGSYITEASLVVVTAPAGGGTLGIGTWDNDTSSITLDDVDGVDAAITVGAIGTAVACNGALVSGTVTAGATSNSDVNIIMVYNTTAFTAGQVMLTVEYITPAIAGRTIAN